MFIKITFQCIPTSVEILRSESSHTQEQVTEIPEPKMQYEVYSIENHNLELKVIPIDNFTNNEAKISLDRTNLAEEQDEKIIENHDISLIEGEIDEEITKISQSENESLKIEDLESIKIDELQSLSDEVSSINTKNLARIKYKNLLCFKCNTKCLTRTDLEIHIEKNHQTNVKFKCEFCSHLYDKYRSFTRHVLTHTVQPQFTCAECGQTFNQKIGLKNHQFKHKTGRNFECDMCDKTFKQLSSLYNHKKIHNGVKNICEYCKEEFTSSLNLKQHKKSKHTNIRDIICKVCDKGYASSSALHYHMLTHSKVCKYLNK